MCKNLFYKILRYTDGQPNVLERVKLFHYLSNITMI